MPLVDWATPRYENHDVIEMTTVTPMENHPDENVGKYSEHVLMLLREEFAPGRIVWGAVWLVYSAEHGRWAARVFLSGPSPDEGDAERRLIRTWKEQITGRMA